MIEELVNEQKCKSDDKLNDHYNSQIIKITIKRNKSWTKTDQSTSTIDLCQSNAKDFEDLANSKIGIEEYDDWINKDSNKTTVSGGYLSKVSDKQQLITGKERFCKKIDISRQQFLKDFKLKGSNIFDPTGSIQAKYKNTKIKGVKISYFLDMLN